MAITDRGLMGSGTGITKFSDERYPVRHDSGTSTRKGKKRAATRRTAGFKCGNSALFFATFVGRLFASLMGAEVLEPAGKEQVFI